MEVGDASSSSFPTGKSAQEKGLSYLPGCYVVPPSQRSNLTSETTTVPVVDLAGLHDPKERSRVIKAIGSACRRLGFFQPSPSPSPNVLGPSLGLALMSAWPDPDSDSIESLAWTTRIINHGICQSVLDGALSSAFDFFNLPMEERMKFMSTDVHKPVRYATSLKDGVEKVQLWRNFLKHYAYPLKDWIESWPKSPANYRENMGKYAVEVRKLALELTGAITESLGIGPVYLDNKMEEGMQVMAVNCYPACPKPELALGPPPHSDHSCLTVLLQSSQGLEIMNPDEGTWMAVPKLEGALQVHLGDHLEVLSNGLYKSVVHRATLNDERTRISIGSFHSLGMDEKMETAKELIDEQHPKGYKASSFRDFLKFLSANSIGEGRSFIETLKIKE